MIKEISTFQIDTMNSIDNKQRVDFRYFISLALHNELSWECVTNILDESTSNLALSKQLNRILIQELKESESKHCKNPSEHTQVNQEDTSTVDNAKDSSQIHYEEIGSSHVEIFFENVQNENDFEFYQKDTKENNIVKNKMIKTESDNIGEMKHVAYNFKYDFVESHEVETKQQTIFNPNVELKRQNVLC